MKAVQVRKYWQRYWLMIPGLAMYCVFVLYPMIDSLVVSLHAWDGLSDTRDFVGLQNYFDFFKDPTSYLVLRNNLIWTVFMLVFPVGIGLALGVALNRRFRGMLVFRTIYYMPAILPLHHDPLAAGNICHCRIPGGHQFPQGL
jgi:raffinose/stachyose/melibiose transport system permease protein